MVKAADWSWLAGFGAEPVAPALPDGWQVMDVSTLRFAVPANWIATMAATCVLQPAPGVVLLPFLTPELFCGAGNRPLPADRLVISAATGEPPTSPPDAHVGSFDAWQLPNSLITTYRLTSGIQIAVAGPESAQILASFTDAGAVRILQTGPMVTTTDWKPVSVAGVTMLVPPNWDIRDLAHQDTSKGFFPDPGTCGAPWFYTEVPRAFIGEADPKVTVGCLMIDSWPITPIDGVWTREMSADAKAPGPIVARGSTNGREISVVEQTLPTNNSIDPVLDLLVRASGHTVRISIGVGPDPSVARTILHSLRST